MAVPFDPQRLAVTGTAVPVVEGVLQSPVSGAAQYSFSATGSLVYVLGGVQSNQSKLVWVSRDGAEQPLTAPARAYRGPRLSPDGRRVAVGITEQESHYRILERLEGGGMGVVYKAEGTKLHRFVGSTGSLSRSNSCWSWGQKLPMRSTQHTRRGLFTATSIAGGQSLEASTAVCQLPEKIIRPVLG
jgi:hypothetical protein